MLMLMLIIFCVVVLQVPGPWVALMAGFIGMVRDGTRFTSLDEVRAMATRVGLPADDLRLVLHYFNQLGLITWFDDAQLENLVVLVSH